MSGMDKKHLTSPSRYVQDGTVSDRINQTKAKQMTVHYFETTAEAYDACQCDEALLDGDTIVVRGERVVGIVDTWPFAITAERGQLHCAKGFPDYLKLDHLSDAMETAKQNGWTVSEAFAGA